MCWHPKRSCHMQGMMSLPLRSRSPFFSVHSHFFLTFLAFDFYRFCVVIRFFHPRNNSQWPPTSKDFYTRSFPLHYFLILILEKEPVFPFSMLSAKQGHYWYHFYNVFGMTWRIPRCPPLFPLCVWHTKTTFCVQYLNLPLKSRSH